MFPDFSAYTPVNISDYAVEETTPGHTNMFTRFRTPDDLACGFNSDGTTAGCNFTKYHGIPPIPMQWSDGTGFKQRDGLYSIDTNSRLRALNESPPDTSALKTLPPMHSITVNSTTCGVDDSGTTACVDGQGQAFMLSPQWSGWLPHVTPAQPLTVAPIKCTASGDLTTCRDGEHGFTFSPTKPGKYHQF
jgi:hypothetical protein